MAYFYATERFNLNTLDWNQITRDTSATSFVDNRNDGFGRQTFSETHLGTTYTVRQPAITVEDAVFLWWDPDHVTYVGGNSIVMGTDVPEAGDMTFLQTTFNENGAPSVFSMYGFSIDITTFVSAMLSADTADDKALFAQITANKDFVQLSKFNDVIRTGAKQDVILGMGGNDKLFGEGGNDLIKGGAGNDVMSGGNNDDVLIGGLGNDVFNGGAGIDTAVFTGDTRIKANLTLKSGQATGEGTDKFISIENLVGGSRNDYLRGDSKNNILSGEGGNDRLEGRDGNDVLNGGAQNDNLDGGAGKDRLLGGNGIDSLFGGDQNDRLFGNGGGDTLNGGRGNDFLVGGGGVDQFAFNTDGGRDVIRDMQANVDKIIFINGPKRFAALELEDIGKHTKITAKKVTIIVQNTDPGDLDKNDFRFLSFGASDDPLG